MTVVLAILVAGISFCRAQEACDPVSIDSAGDYKIKHSKIRAIATTHNRSGVAIFVSLWPGDGPQDQEIVDLSLQADLKPTAVPECKVLPQIGPNVEAPGFIICWQSIKSVLGLAVVAKFKIDKEKDYRGRFPHILDYLTNDVFNCGAAGTRI
jgi:hypothetical protein